MNKKIIFFVVLLTSLVTGCDANKKESKNIESQSNTESSNDSAESIDSSFVSLSSDSQAQSSTSDSSEVGMIVSRLKTEQTGRYIEKIVEDEDTFEYVFSYNGAESFSITSSINNKYNNYFFRTNVVFDWGELKNASFDGEATEGNNNLVCQIECNYGEVPNIELKTYKVIESSFSNERIIEGKIKELVSSQKKAYQAVQKYINGIKKTITLW